MAARVLLTVTEAAEALGVYQLSSPFDQESNTKPCQQ